MQDLSSRVMQPQPDTSTAVALLQLQQQQQLQQQNQNQQSLPNGSMLSPSSYQGSEFQPANEGGGVVESPVSIHSNHGAQGGRQEYPFTTTSNEISSKYDSRSTIHQLSEAKRKRGDFEVRTEHSLDVVSKGLISYDDAVLYFRTFFQGCVSSRRDTEK